MGRHESHDERRQQILEGALKAFSEKGYLGASNKDIANAAGINSSALIYHYFDNKQALFEQVIEAFMPPVQLVQNPDVLLSFPVEVVLKRIATTILDIVSEPKTNALFRIMLSEAVRSSDVSDAIFKGGSQKIMGFMYRYFDHLMTQGVIERVDLGVVVRCFIGPFAAYMLTDQLVKIPDDHSPQQEIMIEAAVMIFLKGLGYRQI